MLSARSVVLRAISRRAVSSEERMAKTGDKVVCRREMHRYMVDCLTTAGAVKSHASQLADVLIEGDVRGHYSHGLNRLEMYVQNLQEGSCERSGEPTILNERAGTAWVDGRNLLGPVVGNFCIDLAVKKAKEAGVGWVSAKGSNHFGIAGWYSLRAMRQGCMGLAFTNTSPLMYPTRAAKPALGTNPISLAAAGQEGDAFVLDMATTTVAIGKVELASRKGEQVPATWGADSRGLVSTDPDTIVKEGALLPLGGDERSGGYKGYGMASLVEIFCGVLAGAHWGPNVRRWGSNAAVADLGQCFIAVDTSAFAPDFSGRMQEFMDTMRGLPQSNPDEPVEVAGDVEKRHEELVHALGGIPYHPNQIEFANNLAKKLGVAPPQLK
ncbi:hypothetical protein PRIPAC_90696 [Pristionchus pacificus]|uniref:Uncharacterized protein n=1 Tax=Pristionchus pacificus TaxID=54126 RepID=A0A2A6CTE3_PRIPA|nr:hypothetical protein PRIPAC_90696 [Pristionchus pacificus]|eukprot:PDM81378.1 hypothetical protein PRIPAC_35254 [Pristionchus pacificus]